MSNDSEFGEFQEMLENMKNPKKVEKVVVEPEAKEEKPAKRPREKRAAPEEKKSIVDEVTQKRIKALEDKVQNLENELEVASNGRLTGDEIEAIKTLYHDVQNRYKGKVSKWQKVVFEIVEKMLGMKKGA